MSQPTPTPAPDSPPPTPDNTDPREQAKQELKGLIKETMLEVITERESAPPKGKKKHDVLQMLFGPAE